MNVIIGLGLIAIGLIVMFIGLILEFIKKQTIFTFFISAVFSVLSIIICCVGFGFLVFSLFYTVY